LFRLSYSRDLSTRNTHKSGILGTLPTVSGWRLPRERLVELGIVSHGSTENFRKQRPLVVERTVVVGAAHCSKEQISYCEFPQRLQAPNYGQ
jgi:hypothetical protein